MPFSSAIIGTTSQSFKPFWYQTGSRVAQAFTLPYNSSHRSPGLAGAVTPYTAVSMEALVNGGTIQYGITDSYGGAGAYTSPFSAGGGSESGTRNLIGRTISKNMRSGTRYRAVVVKAGGSFVGMVRTGSGAQTAVLNSQWQATSYFTGPAYTRIYYNTVPSQVLSLSAEVVNGAASSQILLSWAAPSSNGGAGVNGYRIQWSKVSTFKTIAGSVSDTRSTVRSYTVKGLEASTTYYFRVAALNAVSDAWGSAHSGLYSTTATQATAAYAGSDPIPATTIDYAAVQRSNYFTLRGSQSCYAVLDNSDRPIDAETWVRYGGAVYARVDAQNRLAITLVGPSSRIPGFTPPYKFAIQVGEDTAPALTVYGTGVRSVPVSRELHTGNGMAVADEEGPEIDNPVVANDEIMFDLASHAFTNFSGANRVLNFSVPESAAIEPGGLFVYKGSVWRAVSVTRSNGQIDVEARQYTRVEDMDSRWSALTVDQMNSAYAGLTVDNINIKPLHGTS